MKRIFEFLQDDTGLLSATRLAFLTTVFSVLTAWLLQCFTEKKVVPIDQSVIYLVGVLMVGKVSQSFSENAQSK